MTTNIISSAGSVGGAALGTAVGGPIGGVIGGAIGGVVGRQVGYAIEGNSGGRNIRRNGYRLADLTVQSSSYGEMIPIIYGTCRLAGNIIWAQPVREVSTQTQTRSGGGKGGGGQEIRTDTAYNYYATLAISICEGPVDELIRVWANNILLNQENYNIRLYNGSEVQMPDPLIEAIEGIGKTPAYRGVAYVVIEDFPLGDFGNHIPNFTFEVRKTLNVAAGGEVPVEDMIKSIVLIPGAGEFVYDDVVQNKIMGEELDGEWVQRGNASRINQNNHANKADGLVALDQLAATCKNVEWVAPVVCWFGDDINAGACQIMPGVEFQQGASTGPDVWQVARFVRGSARQLTLVDGKPQYGGTPSDASLLRYLQELKKRGYKIMFNPMFFMDTKDKPWRGRVTGSVGDVVNFFVKTNGYNEMIMHYASLVKYAVDAFVIGSELVGLTSIRDKNNNFPAVDALINLAAMVKKVVGNGVMVTYAADWSEYHHTDGGWYNLDPLWASSDIDMVGIDAYFPLTDREEPTGGFAVEEIVASWRLGEGYEWYYRDLERTSKVILEDKYAWKNIEWWWQNPHINPDGKITKWLPQSKKIWFTEYGFPSVDGATNQPNVFYDPTSQESKFPYYSHGRVDFRAQRNAITAMEKKWLNSSVIERKFLWTWDARPFPYWPDLTNIWADGGLWRFGHWVQGKFGASSLAAIIADLSKRAGLTEAQIDISSVTDIVDGYILKNQINIRDAVECLRGAYFFDAVESNSQVKYIKRGGDSVVSINEINLIANANRRFMQIARQQEIELPQKVDVIYLNKSSDYQNGNQHSQRVPALSQTNQVLAMPIVMNDQAAKNIADVTLFNSWQQRNVYEFILPLQYAYIEPTDIIRVTVAGVGYVMRVVETRFMAPGVIRLNAVAEDSSVYNFYNEPGKNIVAEKSYNMPGDSVFSILDLPAMPGGDGQGCIYYAVCGKHDNWKGANILCSSDGGINYHELLRTHIAAVLGVALDVLKDGVSDIFDYENKVTVSLYGNGELESLPELSILNGSNLAKIGDEIIQFKTAVMVAEGKYILSGLLRGRQGTEKYMATHKVGEEFVLLDSRLVKEVIVNDYIGVQRLYKAVSIGQESNSVVQREFTYQANCLRPFAPVHVEIEKDAQGNFLVSWVRRTRTDGQWRDNVDVPLGENSELYQLDIISSGSIVRSITGITAPSYKYEVAEQLADFGGLQSEIKVEVKQVSAVVG